MLWLQRSRPFQEGLLPLSKPYSPVVGKLGVVGDSGSHKTNTNQCSHTQCNMTDGPGHYGGDSTDDHGPGDQDDIDGVSFEIRQGARTGPTLVVEVKVNGTRVDAMVDMGVEVTLLLESFFRSIDDNEISGGGADGPQLKLHNAEDGSSMDAQWVEARMRIRSFEKT